MLSPDWMDEDLSGIPLPQRKQPRVYRLFGFAVWKEEAGIISPGPCWVCGYGMWMHTDDTLCRLLWSVLTEYKSDRHLVS